MTNDSSPLSQGGNVHPLTSHVLAFMEGLLAYDDTAMIIASLYVEDEKRRNQKQVNLNFYFLFCCVFRR